MVETSLHNPDAIATENLQEIFDSVKKEVHHDIKMEGLLEWHKNYQLVDNACHRLDELSVEAWNQYQECPGNYCQLVKGGFISIVNHLLQGIPKNTVKCSHPVEKVIWEGSNAEGTGVIVKATNGTDYHCNHVIVTCSVGFLRDHWADFFQPNLPADRVDLFKGIGFGSITKVAMMFKEPVIMVHEVNSLFLILTFQLKFSFGKAIARDSSLLGPILIWATVRLIKNRGTTILPASTWSTLPILRCCWVG